MVTNSDGLVAVQHYISNGCSFKVKGEPETVYTFIPKHNVSLAFVQIEHVDRFLREKAKMCCGKEQNKFYLASEINANLWMYGSRHKPEGLENVYLESK